jgi:hypothetical protein
MSEENKNDAPVEVFTQDVPTPEELAEYERVKARHIEYAKELHEVTEKYIREAHFAFAHRTMALVFSWENGEEGVDAPVRVFPVSYPNEFLARSSPGSVFRALQRLLGEMEGRKELVEEIQRATGNSIPKSSGVIH